MKAVRIFLNLFVVAAAFCWRRLLFRTTVIAIAGSSGKTTAKECLAAILGSRYPITYTPDNANGRWGLPRTILRTRPWHRFAVLEVGVDRPGRMRRSALLTRPDIVVMLGVGVNHSDEFLTLEVTAREKGKLLQVLPRGGLAILNGDDCRVRAMHIPDGVRVRYFGASVEHDTWADEISARWPDRLRCRVRSGTESQIVQTRLVGTHWVHAIVAAMEVARCCGVDFAHSAAVIGRVEPHRARLEPKPMASGALVLRDEFNGSWQSFVPALELLRSARVERRVLVTTGCIDTGRDAASSLQLLLGEAKDAVELVVLVGESDPSSSTDLAAGFVRRFLTNQEAARFLKQDLRDGDLVLLKAPRAYHLSRTWFGLHREVRCKKSICWKEILCDSCPEL
jgi:UDP-N-acetylmuramoyl-tripeptide--D-alanyl-D-alanine ligase